MCKVPSKYIKNFFQVIVWYKGCNIDKRGAFKRLNMETIPIISSRKTCMCRIMRGVVQIHINICNILYNGSCLMSFGLKGSNGKMMTMS